MAVSNTKCTSEKVKEQLFFHGSSEEDIAYAKTFWKSVQLLPPMESRLVSSHISQRLRPAPANQETSNKSFKFVITADLDKKAKLEQKMFAEKREKIMEKRTEDITFVQKLRQARIKLEKSSGQNKYCDMIDNKDEEMGDPADIQLVANLDS